MSEANVGAEFLEQRYSGLANSSEVKSAARRTEARTGVEVPRSPKAFIQNYLDRFKEIIERKDPEKRANGITALKKILIDKHVVRVEDIPDSYWQTQMKVVRERGESGDWQNLSEEEMLKIKREHLAQTKEDQQGSLEEWIDYLTSDKLSYLPDHLKYWAFQGMLRLERYEKGSEKKGIKGRFPKRPTGKQRSVKMFPEVNGRSLKFIAQAYEAQAKNQNVSFRYDISNSARTEFLEHLARRDFRSLYGWGQEHIPPISEKEMQTTEGKWITYRQNSDSKMLTAALQGKGSGWCIAGENLANQYLSNGNLYVYYTRDQEGKFTIPRVVIVQKGNLVTEVRGIEWEENVDSYIKGTDIIGKKLKELSGGEKFFEIDADTKRLTAIDKKILSGGLLTREELAFLYEIDRQIKYFGYKKDPRIDEIRRQRNPQEDMTVVFGCDKSQIAHSISQIHPDTKVYDGPIEPDIFNKLQGVEHIYISFPEGKIRVEDIVIGGRSKDQLGKDLKQGGIKYAYAENMIKNLDFTTLPASEIIKTVRLKMQDLGFTHGATTAEIIGTKDDIDEYGKPAPFTKGRMTQLGLHLCLPEVGIYQRLKDTNQPLGERYYIAMKPIIDRDGWTDVFELYRNGVGLWLNNRSWAGSDAWWGQGSEFMFALRPPAAPERSSGG